MKKDILFLLLTILSLSCYSQITYENGYYIDINDHKVECLIKNMDWKNNPTEFVYKTSENGKTEKITLKEIKEFGINNISKYVKHTVNIDRSGESINSLSSDRNPNYKEEELLLKVLVEGEFTLYQYTDGNLKRFFYNKPNDDVEQLVFKRYKTEDFKIGKNNRFRQQLWNDLQCSSFKSNKVENLEYKKDELVKYFVDYNKCKNLEYVNYEEGEKRDLFNLTIRPRINNSSLVIQKTVSGGRDTDFGSRVGVGLGVEAEFILPFNKNKWSIAIEPTFQNFKAKKNTTVDNVSGGVLISNAAYTSVEIPLSLRHYFFLNDNSKLFINASYIFDLSSNSSIDFTRNDGTSLNSLDIETRNNLAFGLGYKHVDKYSIELRYQTSRNILGNYLFWSSEYETLSLILGYSFF